MFLFDVGIDLMVSFFVHWEYGQKVIKSEERERVRLEGEWRICN